MSELIISIALRDCAMGEMSWTPLPTLNDLLRGNHREGTKYPPLFHLTPVPESFGHSSTRVNFLKAQHFKMPLAEYLTTFLAICLL